MSEPEVLCGIAGGVATLTLNRPDRLNPISLPAQRLLLGHLERLRDDKSVRVLVLTGAGRAFCVGADLADMDAATAGGRTRGQWMSEAMDSLSIPLVTALRQMPVPTLAAVNGPAAGGAVGLALAADVVIAARSAYFMLPFVPRLALMPDLGATWHLSRRLGPARAMALALLGDRLPAEQAAAWGLIWSCVDDADFAAATRALAARLAALPAQAVLSTRQAIDAAATNDFGAQIRLEGQLQSALADRDDFAEGVRAFLDKRAPRFGA